jgi:hypothetical protein
MLTDAAWSEARLFLYREEKMLKQKMLKQMFWMLPLFLTFVFTSTALAGFGVGGNILLSQPQEEFANVSETGGGLGLNFLFSPPLLSVIAVRADFAFIFYGSDSYEDEVAGIPLEVKTQYQSVQFTAGPQFQTPVGPLRFYAAPMAGVYNYSTTVSIEGTDISETESSTTKFGWNFSGGILVQVYRSPIKKFKVDIDLGAKYHTIKDAVELDIDGEKQTSDANDVTIHLGALFSF